MGKGAKAALKATAAEKKAEIDRKHAAAKPPIPPTDPNPGNKTIILDGILASPSRARNQEEWNFVKEILHGKAAPSEIRHIKIGASVGGKAAASVTCWHATKPSTNFTVFFRWVRKPGTGPGMMRVIGYGNHIRNSNQKYEVLWSNGVSNSIDLKETSAGPEFLPPVDV